MNWIAVPDGSTLVLTATGSDANFQLTGIRTRDADPPIPLAHGDVVPKLEIPLKRPSVYSATINVVFLGAAATTVTFTGEILKPDGERLGALRTYTTTGTQGDVDVVIATVATRQGDGQ